jgi:hypothetical protein
MCLLVQNLYNVCSLHMWLGSGSLLSHAVCVSQCVKALLYGRGVYS